MATTSDSGTQNSNSNSSNNGAGPETAKDTRPVFFFDIDNCLYPRSYKIHDLMKVLIHQYFVNHLGELLPFPSPLILPLGKQAHRINFSAELSPEDATNLHRTYYTQYGLALSGLVRHHTIDVMEYNRLVDDSLPLESIIQPSQSLIHLLTSLRNSQTCSKLWLFTNAYINHARRVVKLLGVEEFFDGITYCDYEQADIATKAGKPEDARLMCKPDKEIFDKAMLAAGLTPGKDEWRCYFVDDSRLNCVAAKRFGWGKVAHLVEPEPENDDGLLHPGQDGTSNKHKEKNEDGIVVISDLGELREVFPELFTVEGEEGVKNRVGHEPLREESPGRELPRRIQTPLPEEEDENRQA